MRILESKLFGYDENGQPLNYINAAGDSTEVKPATGIVDGSQVVETDTGDIYIYNEKSAAWVKMLSLKG
jgi:hypothetical protein